METKFISFVPSNKPDSIYCSFCYKDLVGLPPLSYSTFSMGKRFEDLFPNSGKSADLSMLSCNECCKTILQKEFLSRTIMEPMTFYIKDI
jgi:hypothetical protein